MSNIVSFADILFRIKLLFIKDKELYAFCYHLTGFTPRHLDLYKLAFSHKSRAIALKQKKYANNERLEYLGDAVIGAIVADLLYKMYPRHSEGFLTNTRSKIVKRETLSMIAMKLGLDKVVHPVMTSHSHNSYIYGNALEALIGAVYLDCGYDQCSKFVIKRIIKPHINIRNLARTEINFKSKLLEWGQKHHVPISFELVETTVDGSNSQMFRSVINLCGRPVCEATGYSKKESHQIASKNALKRINRDAEFRNSIITLATAVTIYTS